MSSSSSRTPEIPYVRPDENCKKDQNDNNGGVSEGDEMSEVDEMGGEVKTIISTGGGTATGGGDTDHGALASAMSMLSPKSAAPALGSTDLVSHSYEDFRMYEVIDYFPREHGTSYNSMYADPISSYMYQPPVNTGIFRFGDDQEDASFTSSTVGSQKKLT